MDIKELINKAVESIENSGKGVSLVGNRMHHPMLIFTNMTKNDQVEIYNKIFTKGFRKIWPQTYKTIISIGYSESNCEKFVEMSTGSVKTIDEIQRSIIETRRSVDAFESLQKWCLYNIIDTISMSSFEEFKLQFDSIEKINNSIFQSDTRSLVIVILDDVSLKREKQELLRQIKDYISQNKDLYEGVLLVSNTSNMGQAFDLAEDILPMLISAIILTNNDSVEKLDDDDYSKRISCFYNKRIMTISHSVLKKPSKNIAIQMMNSLIESAKKLMEQSNAENVDWRKVLGIENGKMTCVDDMLKKLEFNPNLEEIQYMPFKNIPQNTNDIFKLTYSDFSSMIYSNYFDEYVDSYCNTQIDNAVINRFFQEYKDDLYSKVSASDCINFSRAKAENIFNTVTASQPQKNIILTQYFSEYVKYFLRENHIYPRIKDLLVNMSLQAKTTKDEFERFSGDFLEHVPVDPEDLGDSYKLLAENFAQGIEGCQTVRSLIIPGYQKDDFITKLAFAFDKILENNKDVFSRTFVKEWEWRLNKAGPSIYKEINTTFEDHFEKRIFIKANIPLTNIVLEAYMFHTSDRSGQNRTELYEHLKSALKDNENVQFINTGYDDVVEAFRIIDCTNSII